jgi:hypothetical protein
MSPQVTVSMVRRWAEKFILKNEFRPSAGLCAEHFGLDRSDAQALLNEVFATWNARKNA